MAHEVMAYPWQRSIDAPQPAIQNPEVVDEFYQLVQGAFLKKRRASDLMPGFNTVTLEPEFDGLFSRQYMAVKAELIDDALSIGLRDPSAMLVAGATVTLFSGRTEANNVQIYNYEVRDGTVCRDDKNLTNWLNPQKTAEDMRMIDADAGMGVNGRRVDMREITELKSLATRFV